MPARHPAPITPLQRKVYDYVASIVGARGYAPTVREIQHRFGYASPRSVTQILDALERAGWLKPANGMARALRGLKPPAGTACPLCGAGGRRGARRAVVDMRAGSK